MFRFDIKDMTVNLEDKYIKIDSCKNMKATVKEFFCISIEQDVEDKILGEINITSMDTFLDSIACDIAFRVNPPDSLIVEFTVAFYFGGDWTTHHTSLYIHLPKSSINECCIPHFDNYEIDATKLLNTFFTWNEEKKVWHYEYYCTNQKCDAISHLLYGAYRELRYKLTTPGVTLVDNINTFSV